MPAPMGGCLARTRNAAVTRHSRRSAIPTATAGCSKRSPPAFRADKAPLTPVAGAAASRLVFCSLEPLNGAHHLGRGFGATHPVGGLHVLARLERLVLGEEVPDLVELEFRDIADVLDVVPAVVFGRYAQHLVVATGFVGHPEQGDRPRLDQHTRE